MILRLPATTVAGEVSLGICRLETLAWERLRDSIPLGLFASRLSLRSCRSRTFTWELSRGHFHLEYSRVETFDWESRLITFAWGLSRGYCRLGSSTWELRLRGPSLKNFVCERSPWTSGLGDWLRKLERPGRRTLETLGATFVCVVIMSLSKNHSREPRGNIPPSMSCFARN